ncbi:hypothetical protein LUZ60_016146 [Juncus effusus]|nr:hypothetical protein LUZ60_016146 [Juncus effusus]
MGGFLLKLKALGRRASTRFTHLSSSVIASMDMQAQLKIVFDLIDSNGDGKISSAELRKLMISLGHEKSTSQEEVEGMVKELDLNGDGQIDFEEFSQAVTCGGAKGDHEALAEAFEVFDRDKNGLISARELRRVLVGLGHGKCSLRDCRLMIRGVDKNGDGMVDFDEFKSMMTFLRDH